MEKALERKSFGYSTEYQEPQRLSKIGQWRRDNPGGAFIKTESYNSERRYL